MEDLRIIKLLLYVFERMLSLETNISKNCLFYMKKGALPAANKVATLNCAVGLLPVTYLGLPILGRKPQRQDWEGLVVKVRKRLSSWKSQHLSLGSCLMLVNSIPSALPIYWISMFRLPKWMIKEVDRIRKDFLW